MSVKKGGIHKKRKVDPFNNPGVFKMIMSVRTQHDMGCIAGENVTTEKPWKTISKHLIVYDLELQEDSSDFYPLKIHILEYPREEILIGYITDLDHDYDEYYICLSEDATEKISRYVKKIQERQQKFLERSIIKYSNSWKSLGSESEVEELVIKNNRPLFRVEIESIYPIMSQEVHFQFRLVNAARDGYVELLPRGTISNVFRKRIHAQIQVTPSTQDNETQTFLKCPKNVWTQYEYDFFFYSLEDKESKKSLSLFVTNCLQKLDDILYFNSFINLFRDDYNVLVKNELFTKTPLPLQIKEIFSFTDINICKNKLISSVAWHYIIAGIVVLSYMDIPPNIYITGAKFIDDSFRSVHGVNPVLLWAYNDALRPKLYLEAPREILKVSCCPYNEDIIVGGMANGQVVIWDIKNRLRKVEIEEVLTAAQGTYRVLMFSWISWMKNVKNLAIVRTTALSDLEYSHTDAVTDIEWLSPFHKFNSCGKIEELPEGISSLQFATCSLDGSILFWDLNEKPMACGDYKPYRKLRYLKERPPGITVDVSPFRILNRLFKPFYKIKIAKFEAVYYPLSSFKIYHIPINFKEKFTPHSLKQGERIFQRPILKKSDMIIRSHLSVGTIAGEIICGQWEGFNYCSGKTISEETCKIINYACYHDGPIICLQRWPKETDILLTVGGKIFAIWKESLDRPIYWRKSNCKYTHGNWSSRDNSLIRLTKYDGNIEIWQFINKSDTNIAEQVLSGKFLTSSNSEPMEHDKPLVGVGDSNGSFRLYLFPTTLVHENEYNIAQMSKLFKKEIDRKIHFIEWQKQYNLRYGNYRKYKYNKDEDYTNIEKKASQQEKPETTKEKPKKKMISYSSKSEDFFKKAEERRTAREQARMQETLYALKKVNIEILQKQQIPLKEIEKQQEVKKKKIRRRIHRADTIFRENVAINFPNALSKQAGPAADPYAGGDTQDVKQQCFNTYLDLDKECSKYVTNHPFFYEFQWFQLLKEGYQRRLYLELPYGLSKHKKRFSMYKKQLHKCIISSSEVLEGRESLAHENLEEATSNIIVSI